MTLHTPEYAPHRPAPVWVIVILKALGFILLPFGYLLMQSGAGQDAATRTYVHSLTPFDWALSGVGMVLLAAEVVSLYRMRKIAAWIFTAALAFSAFQSVRTYFSAGGRAMMQEAPLSSSLGFAISAAICWYVWHLRGKNILQ